MMGKPPAGEPTAALRTSRRGDAGPRVETMIENGGAAITTYALPSSVNARESFGNLD